MQDPPRTARRCPSPNARYVLVYGQMLSTYTIAFTTVFECSYSNLSLSLSLTFSLSLTLSLTHTHPTTLPHTHTISHSLSHYLTLPPTHTLTLPPPLSLYLIPLRQVRSKALWSWYWSHGSDRSCCQDQITRTLSKSGTYVPSHVSVWRFYHIFVFLKSLYFNVFTNLLIFFVFSFFSPLIFSRLFFLGG